MTETQIRALRKWKAASHFLRQMESQGGTCAICGDEFLTSYNTHSDHDHATNQLRGILCVCCNTALGLFHDNPANLQAAIEYLNAWQSETNEVNPQ